MKAKRMMGLKLDIQLAQQNLDEDLKALEATPLKQAHLHRESSPNQMIVTKSANESPKEPA